MSLSLFDLPFLLPSSKTLFPFILLCHPPFFSTSIGKKTPKKTRKTKKKLNIHPPPRIHLSESISLHCAVCASCVVEFPFRAASASFLVIASLRIAKNLQFDSSCPIPIVSPVSTESVRPPLCRSCVVAFLGCLFYGDRLCFPLLSLWDRQRKSSPAHLACAGYVICLRCPLMFFPNYLAHASAVVLLSLAGNFAAADEQ